jgi:phosphohistidine phosphatase
MFVLLVRHADAGDRGEFARTGRPDSERPLTDKGRKQARAAAAAFRELVPSCGLVLTSPYARAAETADVVSQAWPGVAVERTGALEPGARPEQVGALVAARAAPGGVAVVGHEPDLGILASWMLAGLDDSRIVFKKGGAALLEVDSGTTMKGRAMLRWLMGPKQLAKL